MLFPRATVRLLRQLGVLATRLGSVIRGRERVKVIHTLPVLCGILCAALLVCSLSVGGVLLGFFLPYHRPYTSVTVPDFVGMRDPQSPEDSPLRLVIEYEDNPQVSPGTVISQSPAAGVTRRVYGRDGLCSVLLKVSRPRSSYVLEELAGLSVRDATLRLINQGLQVLVAEEFSDTSDRGVVLSTIPAPGSTLGEGASVTLRVSAGRQLHPVSVPDLCGLTESAADALLRSRGLVTGQVTYRVSSHPAGTVLEQTPAPHGESEEGSAVSYTVSSGDQYHLRTVPDLFGMSREDAVLTLRAYGLVVGDCFPVASAAPRGTVITQDPVAGTPISSATVSVDLYLSS